MYYDEYKEFDRFGRDTSEESVEELEECLDGYIAFLHECETGVEDTFVLNPHRVEQMEFSYKMLLKSIKDAGKDVKVTCRISEVNRTMGVMRVEGKNIVAKDIERFSRACEFANATDVYPLANGEVRIEFTFRNIYAAK